MIQQGWRAFTCPECVHIWKETTRDHESPSGVDCPKCGCFVFPEDHWVDLSLRVDKYGNLV